MFKIVTTTSDAVMWQSQKGKRTKSVPALITELENVLSMAHYYGPNEKEAKNGGYFAGLPRSQYLMEAGIMTPIVNTVSQEDWDIYQVTSVEAVQNAVNALKQLMIQTMQSGQVTATVKTEKDVV